MLKRILILGLAVVALALVAPAMGVGANVAHAQTDPNATAPDSGDTPDTPDAPDQGDTPDAPDQGDGSGCADGARAHASGEDCTPVPQQPAPPSPQPRPSPTSQPKKESHKESGNGSAGKPASTRATQRTTPRVVQIATPVTPGVDTGTIPQGGIQAGAGGTADDGSTAGLLWGGALVLALAAGGLALRRRDGLTS
jgi:hypothetical protein